MSTSSFDPRRIRTASRTRTVFASVGLAAASALILTGCTNPIDQLVQGGIENTIEQVIEENTGADVDIDTGSGASLPDGWPAEIPVPSTSPAFSMAAEGGFQATFEISDAAEGDAIKDQLLADGYEMTGESDMGVLKSYILTGPEWTISLALVIPEDDEAPSLTYLVAPATE
ncbi:hypothetical protein [Microbacterium sp. C7(2022)]|uniref:hypothetical protein n=1 Tax=Microbacterium sp. C7(2022) TaxID=2992759 RepID=UPI00237AB176|nr:hypothetical protein [Microbacterium sp. C7(2022)]MDE0545366.1 hypothetical protein [Microbacterium sp. C7(2022)]